MTTFNHDVVYPECLTNSDPERSANNRARAEEIHELCTRADRPNLTRMFIENGMTVAEVKETLFDALVEQRAANARRGSMD